MVRRNSKKTSDAEADALLSSANKASEHLAVQHIAFMAVCVYVLVIVFGTTDLELLIGKGVKLPVIDVMMPIVGFYAVAPYIVVLVHFNLLLQMQLLSRKLYAFDAAAPEEDRIGGMRDRLHIFPFTYYLIGQPGRVVRALMGIIVSFTLVFLPLITLFSLQIRFLSYQGEAITWFQRIAIYLDLFLVAILWPIILHKQDNWRGYWREVISAHIPRKRVWLAFAMFFAGIVLFLFGDEKREYISLTGIGLCLLAAFALPFLYGWRQMPRPRLPRFLFLFLMTGILILLIILRANLPAIVFVLLISGLLIAVLLALFWNPRSPRGSFALLLTLSIVPALPLAFMVDGEKLEKTALYLQKSDADATAVSKIIHKMRILELNEQAIFAKPVKPETLATIRSGDWQEALKQAEPINLQSRSLRKAQMYKTVLVGADLRVAQLQGAYLEDAQLQGADLGGAQLQGANLGKARLQSAYLMLARLQGAYLWNAHLQGADLGGAQLQGADLRGAQLQGANLWVADLQGADLRLARLQDAYLRLADLQGANLGKAQLQGADLRLAQLQGADLSDADLQGADLRLAQIYGITGPLYGELVALDKAKLEPLTEKELSKLTDELTPIVKSQERLNNVIKRLKQSAQHGANAPVFESCLASSDTPVKCKKRYDPKKPDELKEFTKGLNTFLTNLACESSEIARGILRQSREGFDVELKKGLQSHQPCPGLKGLSEWEKEDLLSR